MFADITGDGNIFEVLTAVFTGVLALFALVGAARR